VTQIVKYMMALFTVIHIISKLHAAKQKSRNFREKVGKKWQRQKRRVESLDILFV